MSSTTSTEGRSWFDRLWSSIADRGTAYAKVPAPDAPPLERARSLAEALLSQRGEASGAAVARELQAVVRALPTVERLVFYQELAQGFGPDPDRLRAAATAYLESPDVEHASRLSAAAEPARQELLRRMNMSPGGTAALVAMRRELLNRGRGDAALRPLDSDLRHLFASWFNRGFLELRRIDWQTPAATLEKLITYEAVHEIQGWEDLRRRLEADRRCFGFFHPALPGEPLIFVEVALTKGLAAAVQPLLARSEATDAAREGGATGFARPEERADTAIFYSISNCQDGLRGVSFGNFLIKQVVEELKAELPGLTCFSTLSPVPGFRRWLEPRLEDPGLLREEERAAVLAAAPGEPDAVGALRLLLAEAPWFDAPAQAEAVRRPLLRLCAEYLTTPREGGRGPSDPVARFHLGNGAQLERINWLGNVAPRGISESYGLMVNYVYAPDRIEANHEAFARGTVVHSPVVRALMEAARPSAAAKRTLIPGLALLRGE